MVALDDLAKRHSEEIDRRLEEEQTQVQIDSILLTFILTFMNFY